MKKFGDNKKALFNYEIIEEFEAGISLLGPEVKSIRKGQVSLKESFATLRGTEIMLTNTHISPYHAAGNQNPDPTRPRKLLLKKDEALRLVGKVQKEGLTLIPLYIYEKNRLIKVKIGLAKGKKKYDKRETLKKRDQEREIKRALKNRA